MSDRGLPPGRGGPDHRLTWPVRPAPARWLGTNVWTLSEHRHPDGSRFVVITTAMAE